MRPNILSGFATSTSFIAPGKPWNGLATKNAPSSALIASGLSPTDGLPSDVLNYVWGNQYTVLNFFEAIVGITLFGDGSDGAVSVNGTSSYAFNGYTAPVSGVYTLTRDVYFSSLTLAAGVTIKTANFKVFVAGLLTFTAGSYIRSDGNNGVGVTGGAALPSGSLGGSYAGANGTTVSGNSVNSGVAGSSATNSLGGGGGQGGSQGVAAVGPGGTAAAPAAGYGGTHSQQFLFTGVLISALGVTAVTGGAGGGSGGGGNSNSTTSGTTGGGGGGGGVCAVYAYNIAFNSAYPTGTANTYCNISAMGGNGGNGVASGAGSFAGGGGGGGGLIIVVCYTATYNGNTIPTGYINNYLLNVNGGNAGATGFTSGGALAQFSSSGANGSLRFVAMAGI